MPFVSPFNKVTCPFCFRQFHLRRAPTRVISASGETQPDNAVANFLGIPPPEMAPVEEAPSGLWPGLSRRFFIPVNRETGNVIRRRICPFCHMALPTATANGQMTSQIIAVVGSRASGKSNYFGVLIELLESRYADEVGFAMWGQETFSVQELARVTSDKLFQERYGSLFNESNRHAVAQTMTAQTNPGIRIPLIYRLSFPKKAIEYLSRPFSDLRAADLVIFDAAGEDMEDLTAREQFWRYALRASGILFLIDPFGYESIRGRLPRELQERLLREQQQFGAKPVHAVNSVLDSFTSSGLLGPGKKLSTPAAFVLTKCDMLRSILPDDSLLFKDPKHERGFNMAECQQVSEELQDFLRTHQAVDLIAKAENAFKTHCFFGISALGGLPEQDLSIREPRPFRVPDPLFWVLRQLGHIPAMRDGT